MACAAPIENAASEVRANNLQRAVDLNNAIDKINKQAIAANSSAALIGHTLCACQTASNYLLAPMATISACSLLGGVMGKYPLGPDMSRLGILTLF